MAGDITFLLTDVEGSTRRWEREPEAMSRALVRHDAVMGEIIKRFGGTVVKPRGEGDSVFSIFSSPVDAVAAALAIQQRLPDEPWETSQPLKVRIAIHTGPAEPRDGDWYGPTVNRCARLRGAAHGAQVVVSQAVHDQVSGLLPDGCLLRDLGPRRLKDLSDAERVYQLEHPSIPAAFPPLLTLDARQHNLPVEPTELLGREHDARNVRELFASGARLVTLIGPGGVGKTRLSLQVAAESIDDYEHGVWFVPLAAVDDATLVPAAIASALCIPQQPGRPVLDAVIDHCRDRQLLFVLDNFEQIIDAALVVSDVLAACARVAIIVTSREWLNLRAEHTYDVAPLAPGAAIELFARRAIAADPAFVVDDANRDDVAALCARLDFLPLAIELVGARVRVATITELLAEFPLDVADAGPRDLPARQRTLRHAIAWSYDRLEPGDQARLRVLGAFAGGCDPDAFAAVGAGDRSVESLVAKSLARVTVDDLVGTRYSVLVSIRDFAREMAARAGEEDELSARHARYYDGYAAAADEQIAGPHQATWLARLEADHPNFRLALAWSEKDAHLGLRLAGNLARFWWIRGHWNEARQWYDVVLGRGGGGAARAAALLGAGNLAGRQGDIDEAERLLRECADRADAAADDRTAARAFLVLAELFAARNANEARRCCEAARSRFEAVGDGRGAALALANLGLVARFAGELEEAADAYRQALAVVEPLGDVRTAANLAQLLADLSFRREDWKATCIDAEQALACYRQLDDRPGMARCLLLLGGAYGNAGDLDRAVSVTTEAASVCAELGDVKGALTAYSLLGGIHERGGAWGEASAQYERLAELARTADESALGDALVDVVKTALLAGDRERATRHLSEALALARDRADADLAAALLNATLAADDGEGAARALAAAAGIVVDRDPYRAAMLLSAAARRGDDSAALAATLRTELGPRYDDAWNEGAALGDAELPAFAAQITSGA